MKNLLPLFLIVLVSCTSKSREWQTVEQNFRTMPLNLRPSPLWFWNDTQLEPTELILQMEGAKEAGYGGLCALPYGENLKPKYLTEVWFDMYRTCLEKARELGMTLILYDEYGWPSGTAGGTTRKGDNIARFKQKYPEHTSKYLRKIEYNTGKGSVFETELPHGQLMAAVAMDTLTYERIDLINHVAAGKLKWQIPGSGHWKVMLFSCVDAGNTIVDYLSPEAVGLYINMTHDEYYKRLSEYFGKTIISTFYDEISLLFAQNGRMWTPEFNQKFESKYGFSSALYYPALWYDIGAETAQARNYLYGFRTDLYAEGYPKLTSDWSVQHGISGTGHQDNEETMNCVGMSGDLMKCFKYQDVPGIDKIGGNRPAERFYKIVSSAAYNWEHPLVMSETYGGMGNITWDEIFGIAMEQYAKGINFFIPHAVWYNPETIYYLPELSLRNPIYADSLRIFNDYISRLNAVMQNDARWVGDVAILYPIHTMQSEFCLEDPAYSRSGQGLDYVDVGVALFDSLKCDYMFLHPEILDENCRIDGDKLLLENKTQHNAFTTLVVPACRTISLSNLEKIRDFARAGGLVIFTSFLPEKATMTTDDDKVTSIVSDLLNSKKAIYVEHPTPDRLKTVLNQFSGKRSLQFTSGTGLLNIHKQFQGRNLWFFANPDVTPKTVDVELGGEYRLETWNPHTGETGGKIAVVTADGKTSFQLDMDGCKSLFIVEK